MNINSIAENIIVINKKIETAVLKVGRRPDEIKLIAVSKTVDVDMINNAIQEKIYDFGENRVQELVRKSDSIKEGYNWHFIGKLQTNKVKTILGRVKLIHSLDRFDLALEIQRRAYEKKIDVEVLVQVNVAEEATKAGIKCEEAFSFVREISELKNIKVMGLMTVAPYADNPEEVRGYFRKLNKIYIDIQQEKIDNINMQYLSMGMSNDFEVAIEEGANMIRIGTAIFGERNYSQK